MHELCEQLVDEVVVRLALQSHTNVVRVGIGFIDGSTGGDDGQIGVIALIERHQGAGPSLRQRWLYSCSGERCQPDMGKGRWVITRKMM